jgi:hypothetical protein
MSIVFNSTKLYLRKRELLVKFVVKISVFSLVFPLFFFKPQEGVFMRSVCEIKSFVYYACMLSFDYYSISDSG